MLVTGADIRNRQLTEAFFFLSTALPLQLHQQQPHVCVCCIPTTNRQCFLLSFSTFDAEHHIAMFVQAKLKILAPANTKPTSLQLLQAATLSLQVSMALE